MDKQVLHTGRLGGLSRPLWQTGRSCSPSKGEVEVRKMYIPRVLCGKGTCNTLEVSDDGRRMELYWGLGCDSGGAGLGRKQQVAQRCGPAVR